MKFFLISLLIVILGGCTKKVGPEQALRGYINYRFSKGQDKASVLNKVTDKLHKKIDMMAEQDFKRFSNVKGLKQKKVNILLKKCSDMDCNITYTLSYEIYDESEKVFSAEVKKIAELKKVENTWKVSDVSNIKTFYDSKEIIID